MFFFKKYFRFKNLIFRFIHRLSDFTLSLPDYDTKNCLTCDFTLQYQYILQPTVLENKETYQLDGVTRKRKEIMNLFVHIRNKILFTQREI